MVQVRHFASSGHNVDRVKLLTAPDQEKHEAKSNISDVLREVDNEWLSRHQQEPRTILGVSDTRLAASVKKLEDEAILFTPQKVKQLGWGDDDRQRFSRRRHTKSTSENRDSIEIPGAQNLSTMGTPL